MLEAFDEGRGETKLRSEVRHFRMREASDLCERERERGGGGGGGGAGESRGKKKKTKDFLLARAGGRDEDTDLRSRRKEGFM